ncbi:MAG: HAMP domain-containing sensor histidine kinase [Bdellovibrionota bacterium]
MINSWRYKLSNYRSIQILLVSLLASVFVVIAVSWNLWHVVSRAEELRQKDFELTQAMDRVLLLDEILTMSARMASASGDLFYEKRYNEFDPELGELLKKIIKIFPEAGIEKYGLETEDANIKLVKMEREAFALVHAGKNKIALNLLSSEKYLREKEIYARGIKNTFDSLAQFRKNHLLAEYVSRFISLILSLVVIVGMIGLWGWSIQRIFQLIKNRQKIGDEVSKNLEIVSEQNRIKDVFTDMLYHDMMTPRTAIKSLTDLLITDEKDEKKLGSLKRIQNCVQRAAEVADHGLKFAKMAVSHVVEYEQLDLGEVVDSAVRDFEVPSYLKRLRVDFNRKGSFPISAHRMIKDIFLNLLGNAIKYCPENSQIDLEIVDQGVNWVISVKDRGPGIPEENKENIFLRFEQLAKNDFRGHGLGLAIAKQIVDMHRGKIWVEDRAGGGSQFFVQLPKYSAR